MQLVSRRTKAWLMAGGMLLPALALGAPAIASAQAETAATAEPVIDEVLVTARRREERPLDAPVVVTAFSGDQLKKQGVSNVPDIARLTPQLTIEPNLSGFGGAITLRGVTSPTSNIASDPAVTINVDGVPINFGAAIRLGQFDLGQVEILKGPQALFFGKNSSGGIMALKSAEPGRTFESQAELGYETEGNEYAVEGFVSGPITPQLLGRLAVRWSDQRGPFINLAPGARDRYEPGAEEKGIRGTLIYQPNDDLRIKLSGIYDKVDTDGSHGLIQVIFCPSGVPSGASSLPQVTDCKADRYFSRADMASNIEQITGDKLFRGGKSYTTFEQKLGVLDISYALPGGLNLNALTGYYELDQAFADSAGHGPALTLSFTGGDAKKTISQELRLSSDADKRFSWMVGGFYQDDHLVDVEHLVFYVPALAIRTPSIWTIDSRTYSAFGQASFDITEQLTLSGGVRYTEEKKEQEVSLSTKFLPEIKFKDTSPEVTLSYRPNENTNLFASYKRGYKSGGFQVSSASFLGSIANPALSVVDNSYKKETVEGFEGGLKMALFDKRLRVDTAIYRYIYSDLQMTNFDPVLVTNRLTNISSSKVRGIEVNVNYAPPVEGLRLRGSIAYNRATYKNFQSACYIGQTIAGGCTIDGPDAGTTPDMQDLSGRPLPRAPKWAGNIGFQYERSIGSGLRLTVGSDGLYQSKAFLAQEDAPWGVRPSKFLWDARLALGAENRAWEVSLIGKNLTNEFYPVSGFQEAFTGVASTTGTNAGLPADYAGVIRRGREIWFRLTVRPELF